MGIIYIFLNENDTTIFQLGRPLKFEVRQNAVEMIMAYMLCISPSVQAPCRQNAVEMIMAYMLCISPVHASCRQNAVEMIMAYKFCISPVHASYSIPDTTLNCSL